MNRKVAYDKFPKLYIISELFNEGKHSIFTQDFALQAMQRIETFFTCASFGGKL